MKTFSMVNAMGPGRKNRILTDIQNPTPTRIPPGCGPGPAKPLPPDMEDKLDELQSQFDRLRSQVRQAQQLSTLGAATAIMAHEVNNLLTPILAYAIVALETDDASLHRKALNTCVKNVNILVAMSQRVLELGAASSGVRETVPLAPVVDDAIAGLCRDPAKDNIHLIVNVDETIEVQADRLQLQQVFFNLLLNARDALTRSGGGRIRITAQPQENRVTVTIQNGGDPIPDELLPHVFEMFQSSKTSHNGRAMRCSGLGLALCRDLVQDNGGTIGVTSDKEQGTVFRVELPAPGST